MINILTNQKKEILSRLIKYAEIWKQAINFNKTYWILFQRPVKPQIPSITYNACDILHTTKIKYLGIILDACLFFSQHIDYIKRKIRTNTNIFRRLACQRMTSEAVNLKLYNAYIRPYLQILLNIYPILNDQRSGEPQIISPPEKNN